MREHKWNPGAMCANLSHKVRRSPLRAFTYLRFLRGLPMPTRGEAGYAACKLAESSYVCID